MFFIKSENRCTDRSSPKLYLGEEKQYETISVYFESNKTKNWFEIHVEICV